MHTTIQNENSHAWAAHIDLHIGNTQKTRRSGGGIGIFYVRNVDESDTLDSAYGYTQQFDGLGIIINLGVSAKTNRPGEFGNLVRGVYNDGSHIVGASAKREDKGDNQCYRQLRNMDSGFTRFAIEYDGHSTSVNIIDFVSGEFMHCFSLEQKLDYNGYFVVSASSGFSVPDSVFLSTFKVFDPTRVSTNHHF